MIIVTEEVLRRRMASSNRQGVISIDHACCVGEGGPIHSLDGGEGLKRRAHDMMSHGVRKVWGRSKEFGLNTIINGEAIDSSWM